MVESVNRHLKEALDISRGARFYKCALQVNPYEYVVRHKKTTIFNDEESYNNAIIEACKRNNVEVIAITDHYRLSSARSLIARADAAGIIVFPGFEAATKEGVHFLCLLDPATSLDVVQARINECGIHQSDPSADSPLGKYDSGELLKESKNWNAICIAAHVCSKSGLLCTLRGTACINVWKDEDLQACAIPGAIDETPEDKRPILVNKNGEYRRERPVALINCQDVSDPHDIENKGATCWIKMSEVSIEGLRQAFLDPESRVRISSDPEPEEHAEIVAVACEGGFLDGLHLHFNENLNALIGGRGTGKSTLIESLRYALNLEPIGEEAKKTHEEIIKNVVQSGTRISVLIRSYTPDKRDFIIERTVTNPSIVRDSSGNILALDPTDILKGVEIFGQHEISELSKREDRLSRMLERFMGPEDDLSKRKEEKRREMEISRNAIIGVQKEIYFISEKLGALPTVEETLKRYKEAQVEDKLKDQSMIVKEEKICDIARDRIEHFKEMAGQLKDLLPLDRAFVSPTALDGLPAKEILRDLDGILIAFEAEGKMALEKLAGAIQKAVESMGKVRDKWQIRKNQAQEAYEKILRELQQSKIDGVEYIRLRKQFEELHPLREKQRRLEEEVEKLLRQREEVLQEWEEIKREAFSGLTKAAKKINKKLRNLIRVEIKYSGDRRPLVQFLQEKIGGRLSEALRELVKKEDLSLAELYRACRAGESELITKFGLTQAQAQKLAKADESVLLELRELELPPTTHIELNISLDPETPEWRALGDLSTGQRATALLFILLLESPWPLIIDQPEDDLDNRFIAEGIVQKMREEKRRRQFIFSTHNANIPVLGDAELVTGLSTKSDHGSIYGLIKESHIGSIDKSSVRELVEEILEGGRNAFETRRRKYGF